MTRKYQKTDALSEALDSKNLEKVLEFISEDCVLIAGNGEAVRGKENIGKVFEGFFPAVKSTKHDVTDIFESGESLVHRGMVTYTRLDDSQLTIPFCDVFKMKDDLIREYYIYIDWSELFN
ncbi:nuclear transport factor 2 family protein [Marinifilum caeruleilacunae]|uniref:Nuclear transport factor 2 family protein n=1 Tax=Marinifilum caeruleilacunae TaxID=2499076 RepID=A0ABX1WQT7_9BACT|nr:nuclear transport factor 2 family protein [Marinifilum caeruleilacunae]NOU58309.1 nuclear transport factor 2 family protein [Marinifilum caeruleilacunae]